MATNKLITTLILLLSFFNVKAQFLAPTASWETGDILQGIFLPFSACTPYAATISTNFARVGIKSCRFELHDTDVTCGSSTRAELYVSRLNTTIIPPLTWYAWSEYLPAGYQLDTYPEGHYQVHEATGTTSPLIGIVLTNGNWSLNQSWDSTGSGVKRIRVTPLGAQVTGQWVDWVIHYVKSITYAGGLLEVYRKLDNQTAYTRLVSIRGSNFDGVNNGGVITPDVDPYPKFGIYKWPWHNPGVYNPNIRIFYQDMVRFGSESNVITDFVIPQPVPNPILLSTSQTNVSCNGGNNGSATISVTSGGTPPFTYLWSPGGSTLPTLTSIPAGTYSVVVTDATLPTHLTAPASVTVTQPTAITATAVPTGTISSVGGTTSVTVSATGGVPPYTGTGTITGQGIGSHTYTVTDANGCIKQVTITINYTSLGTLTATMSKTNVSCFGGTNGTATVTASGGITPYTYLWNTGQTTSTITGRTAATYSVTVTDGIGGTVGNSIAITQPTQLVATANSGIVTTLGGTTTVNVTGSGGTPAYTGTGIISGVTAGSHTYSISDANGCTASVTIVVPYIPATNLAVSLIKTDNTCFGSGDGTISSSVTGGTAPYTYSWSSGQTTPNRTAVTAGTYILTVTDANLITAKDTIVVTQPPVLTASATYGTISVIGGTTSVVVSAVGGTPSYTGTGTFTQGIGTVVYTVTDSHGCTSPVSVTIAYTSSGTLNTILTAVKVTCFGLSNGSVLSSTSGGVTPYTYLWSPDGATTQNITGKVAGTYSVLVTDGIGNTTNPSIVLLQPTQLAVSDSFGAITSLGGTTTVRIIATGGTPPYTGAGYYSSVGVGTHIYTVTDANGCSVNDTVTLSYIPPALSLTYNQNNVTCFGLANGSLGVVASNGVPPYTYLWSNAATTDSIGGLAPNSYSVTVTDAVDTARTLNFTITQPTLLVATATAGVLNYYGGTATIVVTATGGTPPYLGTGSFAGYRVGTYNFTVTDAHGCTANASATVVAIPNPNTRVKWKKVN